MKKIIVQPQGGLCNRMRTIVGVLSLSKKLNRKLLVIWTRDITLNAKFRDLFTLEYSKQFDVIDCPLNSIKYKLLYHLCKDLLHYDILDDSWVCKNARGKDFEAWRYLVEEKKIFIRSSSDILFDGDYSVFKANAQLLNSLNMVSCNKTTIGIHIRRTDNEMSVKFSPTSLFIERAHEELKKNPGTYFYLATDDPSEEKVFLDEFGDRILIYQKHSLDRNNPIAVKDALIDLYNLSCCKKILASYYSSFSDVAALWGNIEKEVIKID